MTKDASRGPAEESSWVGRSFWVWSSLSMTEGCKLEWATYEVYFALSIVLHLKSKRCI